MSLTSNAIPDPFEDLFKKWSRQVYAYAWQFTKSAYLAEEAVQRVFLKLWKNLKAGKTDIPVEAQIRCISRSVIIDLLREQSRRRNLYAATYSTKTAANVTEESFNAKELMGRIEAQVAAMPEMRRKIFTMSRFEELSHREIAERLSLSVKTVENHISIALKTLKNTLTAFLIIFLPDWGIRKLHSYCIRMEVSKELLQRYFSGACSPGERRLIRRLLRKEPEKLAAVLDDFRWEEATPGAEAPGYDEQQLYAALVQQINRYEQRPRAARYLWYGAAAAVIGIIFFVRPFTGRDRKPESGLVQKETPKAPAAIHYYHNTGRDVLQIQAADGSAVELYPGSEIRFPERFDGLSSRDFWLKGKAKFTVAKNKALPFNVYSKNLVTTALGTVFIVDELSGSTRTRIRLLEGKIKITGNEKELEKPVHLELTPNREIEINPVSLQVISEFKDRKTAFDRGEYFRNDSTSLTFKNMALDKVVQILENNYHLRLQIAAGQLDNRFYSGTFKKSDRVYEDIIREINYLHKINILISKY